MRKVVLSAFVLSAITFVSCSDDVEPIEQAVVTAPETYKFERNKETSVSYSGQTTRIEMAEEFIEALKVETNSLEKLNGMFGHIEGGNDFSNLDLNASSKSIRSKTASSADYFKVDLTGGNAIKADFDTWIKGQVETVFTAWSNTAAAGVAGQIQENGGGSTRYVNEKGLEYNQAIGKGLIGALMADQMLNNYLSVNVLDEASNVADNDDVVLSEGKNYTTMEHKWDEAYGYLFGAAENRENPLENIGTGADQKGDDSFLSKYLDRVNDDTDFSGIAKDIFNAFKLGRAAIVAKNYKVRDEQAKIIRDAVSKTIAIRAVYYLQQGKVNLTTDKAAAFHDLSEGFGFVYSLRFTRDTSKTIPSPHLTAEVIDGFTETLLKGNGFWDIEEEDLDAISDEIAKAYGFEVKEAAN